MIVEQSILPIQNEYIIGERVIKATLIHDEPLIVKFHNVLSSQECEQLILASKDRLKRSKLAYKEENNIRTSSGMFFDENENNFIAEIEQRIAQLMHVPLHHAEGLQVLHYAPGQEFKAHFDYFSETHPSAANNRISTLIVYLNDVEEGGETSFPELNISVAPEMGCAVYFEYFYQDDKINEKTLHCGEPVIKGEKWVATQWMHKQSFR